MIKAVIFDMDGVLINTEPIHYQCWVEIFKERYGIDLDYEVYKPCIGSTRLHFMNLIKEDYGITFESLEVMNQIMKEKKDEIIARDGFPEMPGVEQMLCCLKDAGYRLAVVLFFSKTCNHRDTGNAGSDEIFRCRDKWR